MAGHLILCGGAPAPRGRKPAIRLAQDGPNANVAFHAEDIGRRMLASVSPPIADLLDIAAYVHVADQCFSRGGPVGANLGQQWRRDFLFVVPVREPERWASSDVTQALERLLHFMSGDDFRFQFVARAPQPATDEYLDFAMKADEVALFSGGLDSLSGTVDHLIRNKGRLLLVSHQSSTKIARRQRDLARELKLRFPNRTIHIPVRITTKGVRTVETTQRTRSFLFGALSAAVAEISGSGRINVFENGIVSLNLPIAGQVVGTAATRTTHPKVLHLMAAFLTTLCERRIEVVNPLLWRTKSDVARILADTAHADLATHTVSCSHVHEMTVLHTHCGRCSQCLDRRFGALAGGLGAHDPPEMYEVDLLAGAREAPLDLVMAESFVRHALELRDLSEAGLLQRFAGEVVAVASSVPGMRPEEVTRAIVDLQRRHGTSVAAVLEVGFRQHAPDLARRALPSSCLLRLVAGTDLKSGRQEPSTLIEPERVDERDFTQSSELRIAVDPPTQRVLIDGASAIHGTAAYSLIAHLVEVAQADIRAGRAPEHRAFVKASILARALGVAEPSIRQCVLRVRERLARDFEELNGLSLAGGALIENSPWRGYRLHPTVLILAPDQVRPAERRNGLSTPMSRLDAAL